MSWFSKITGSKQASEAVETGKKLANRFVEGGFISCGSTKHAPRTNTAEEIKTSIKLIAKEHHKKAQKYAQEGYTDAQKIAEQKAKDIDEFITVMDEMPQRHLSLAHDVIDLSNTSAMTNTAIFPTINFNALGRVKSTNKETTVMGYILNLLPKLSKENPKAVDLAETAVSHSDPANAKFFLHRFVDNFPFMGTEKQSEAVQPLVKPIAESVLKGMPSMDLGPSSKEAQFFSLISDLCKPDTKPENIKHIQRALNISDDIAPNTNANFNLSDLRKGNTETIVENMQHLPDVLQNAERQGVKEFDLSGFLTKNINMY